MSYLPTGRFQLLDTIVLSGAQATMTFSSGGDGAEQYAVDGNADGAYYVEFDLIPTASLAGYLQPNGVTTNTHLNRIAAADTTLNSSDTDEQFFLCVNGSDDHHVGSLWLPDLATGKVRWGHGIMYKMDGTAHTITQQNRQVCYWGDTATNLTSLQFQVSTSTYAAGSKARLFRIF